MWPVSARFAEHVRGGGQVYVRVDAYRGSQLVTPAGYPDGLPLLDGEVTCTAGGGPRRTLSCTLADADLAALFAEPTELAVWRGFRYSDSQAVEAVPLGRFAVEQVEEARAPRGALSVRSAPDRWRRVQRRRFERPKASRRGDLVVSEIRRLVAETYPQLQSEVTARSQETIGSLLWDRDRDAAVLEMARSIGALVYFDGAGQLVIRDEPSPRARPVWTVNTAADDAVAVNASRTADQSRTYSVVVVNSGVTDGLPPPPPVVVADTDPNSPTNVDAIGRIPYYMTLPTRVSEAAATAAGRARLRRIRGVDSQWSVSSVVHAGLESDDTIMLDVDGQVSVANIESVTIPLTVEGAQQIRTRSRAEAVAEDG